MKLINIDFFMIRKFSAFLKPFTTNMTFLTNCRIICTAVQEILRDKQSKTSNYSPVISQLIYMSNHSDKPCKPSYYID